MTDTLLDEIKRKCPPEMLAESDAQKADIHAIAEAVSLGRTCNQPVPIAALQEYLQRHGLWWAIKKVAANIEHPAHDAADAVMDVANARYDNIDTSLPIVSQMLGGLVAAGVMEQTDMDALLALGTVPAPITEFDVRCTLWAADGAWLGGK